MWSSAEGGFPLGCAADTESLPSWQKELEMELPMVGGDWYEGNGVLWERDGSFLLSCVWLKVVYHQIWRKLEWGVVCRIIE